MSVNHPLWATCVVLLSGVIAAADVPALTVHDQDLQVDLCVAAPDIVTPIGLAADRANRLYVLESHTHSRPRQYEGPRDDRIKVFVDEDGDGRPDRSWIYASDLKNALNLAFSPAGELYVIQQYDVIVLHDRDGDGVSDARTSVLKVETKNSNPHGVLLGLAFSTDDWLYVSLGNIGGQPYTYIGSDGRRIEGYGDSGNIVRCRPNGSQLEMFAVGFWNPFSLEVDSAGRLLASDNDPDSRGPNRLVHVIRGGDYGYKSRYGGSGLHPYSAWSGDLPGTLPMIAAVGEAPTGVLDCNRAALPANYADDVLVAVWGTHEVGRVRPRSSGASLAGEFEPIITGDGMFRPVALAAAPDGSIYISDWTLRDYPVHGEGRIWRLTTRAGVATLKPCDPFAAPRRDEGEHRLNTLLDANRPEHWPMLREALRSDDPFVLSSAVTAAARTAFRESVLAAIDDADERVRLGALLALRRAQIDDAGAIMRKLLDDRSAAVRKMALIWAGESVMLPLAGEIDRAVSQPHTPADLFEVYLATTRMLTEAEATALRRKTPGNQVDRTVDQRVIVSVLEDRSKPAAVRALALRYVPEPDAIFDLLAALARGEDESLAIEAIQTLAQSTMQRTTNLLGDVAMSDDRRSAVRAEAIAALSGRSVETARAMSALLNAADSAIALAAARSVRPFAEDPLVRDAIQKKYRAVAANENQAILKEQLAFALYPPPSDAAEAPVRPVDDDQWFAALDAAGDIDAGRRVFFSAAVGCFSCHAVRGRGGRIGPDLSHIGSTVDRRRLINSIMHPEQEMSPEFQAYQVLKNSGEMLLGTQFHYRGDSATLILLDGREVKFKLSDTVSYGPLPTSFMPQGLENLMSVGEFRDLVAYLMSLK